METLTLINRPGHGGGERGGDGTGIKVSAVHGANIIYDRMNRDLYRVTQ